jgi:hypothetical protein
LEPVQSVCSKAARTLSCEPVICPPMYLIVVPRPIYTHQLVTATNLGVIP